MLKMKIVYVPEILLCFFVLHYILMMMTFVVDAKPLTQDEKWHIVETSLRKIYTKRRGGTFYARGKQSIESMTRDLEFAEYGGANIYFEGYFASKPLVLVMGQHSTGKTTFIKHVFLDGHDYPMAHIAEEASTSAYIAVTELENERGSGEQAKFVKGNILVGGEDGAKPFHAYGSLGHDFTKHLAEARVSSEDAPILKKINIFDTPGILDSADVKQYAFIQMWQMLMMQADHIFVLFDPSKTSEFSSVFKQILYHLSGSSNKMTFVLNKLKSADAVDVLGPYGALLWNLGRIFTHDEASRVIQGSFARNDILKPVYVNCTTKESLREFFSSQQQQKKENYIEDMFEEYGGPNHDHTRLIEYLNDAYGSGPKVQKCCIPGSMCSKIHEDRKLLQKIIRDIPANTPNTRLNEFMLFLKRLEVMSILREYVVGATTTCYEKDSCKRGLLNFWSSADVEKCRTITVNHHGKNARADSKENLSELFDEATRLYGWTKGLLPDKARFLKKIEQVTPCKVPPLDYENIRKYLHEALDDINGVFVKIGQDKKERGWGLHRLLYRTPPRPTGSHVRHDIGDL